MELRHLRYFVAIAEERSFTRAAERLWVAQPGLSSQIRRLEAELGMTLFVRHTRGVDLTPAGAIFLERARAALAAADDAFATGRNLEAGLIGTLRLGIATEAAPSDASTLLAGYAAAHPDVEVTVSGSYGGALFRDLRDGRLDAVIAPEALGAAELRAVRLESEPWVVLLARGHRLAGPGPIAAAALNEEPVVITGHRDGVAFDRAVTELLSSLGIAPVLVRGGPGPALYASVSAGEAVALTTAAVTPGRALLARPLAPERRLRFALLWRNETPAPVLRELIRVVGTGAPPVLHAVAA
jgi:DNA-binding transcriptional LysR family regulator